MVIGSIEKSHIAPGGAPDNGVLQRTPNRLPRHRLLLQHHLQPDPIIVTVAHALKMYGTLGLKLDADGVQSGTRVRRELNGCIHQARVTLNREPEIM